jgi:diacylglycerol O-acyltransferase / wax synthase
LSVVDTSFLHQEKHASHMHVGGLMIFEGPPPSDDDFLEAIASRLHLVPRYRQKLTFPRFETGRPLWIDDPSFNIEYHVRHTALPSPGSEEQLRQLAGRIFSQRLDRSKPLWEVWLAQGLEDNRFALISKTHHSLVDGVAGVDIVSVLFDLSPVPQATPPEEGGWTPGPEPSQVELVAEGVKDLVRLPLGLAGRAVGAIQNPGGAVARAREAAEGIGEVVWAGLNPAPEVPLNVPIGPHRRVFWVRRQLDDFKAVKNELHGTVNDVVLAVVAGALGRWLRTRGVRTAGLELRALVPVSVRAEGERGQLGNRIAAMRGPLPVYATDPVERLQIVRQAMDGLKESKQAQGAEVIAGLQDFAPPTLLAQASRLNFSTRLFNLIVTNVPGPQFPLYLLGRELQELVPIAFLPENHALAVAIMSYNGRMDFGLLGDYDAMPDLEEFGGYLGDALDELLEASAAAKSGAAAKAAGDGKAGAAKRSHGKSGNANSGNAKSGNAKPRTVKSGKGKRSASRATAAKRGSRPGSKS